MSLNNVKEKAFFFIIKSIKNENINNLCEKNICNIFNLTKIELNQIITEVFIHKCVNNKLKYVTCLYKNFEISRENAMSNENEAFCKSFGLGYIEIARWLHDTFKFTKEEVLIKNNYAFKFACVHGNVESCEWMRLTFNLTKENIININYNILYEVFMDSFISKISNIISYLYAYFDLNEDDTAKTLILIPNNHKELFLSYCVPFGCFTKPAK